MMKNQQIANIMAFLCIMFGDEDQGVFNRILKMNPDYLIEKFNRYIESTRVEFQWGMHPGLRSHCFQRYMDKWKI
jgi:hypothetical protein